MSPVLVAAAKNIRSVMAQTPKSPVWLSVISGLLLVLSFPKFSIGRLAWIALVPFFFALRCSSSRWQAVLCGACFGLTFFGLSLHWFTYVHVAGWFFVTLIETLFVVLFVNAVYTGKNFTWPFQILWIALAWMATEFFRSEIPVFGFGWNLLAYSQSDFPRILQSANTIGAYGLGFVIAAVNALVFFFLERVRRKSFRSAAALLISILCIFITIFSHGNFHLRAQDAASGTLRVSLLQGNIPQDIKWETVARDKILAIYSKLTQLAAYDEPDLIFWPEAAFPGYFNRDVEAEAIRQLVRQIGITTVIGAPHYENPATAFNSAYVIGPEGEINGRYDKLFLVPFGEYVPLKPLFGWLEPFAYSLGVSDFSAGHEFTVFQGLNGELPFSVLICFENIFPAIARTFASRGARFMAIITNDAWFGPTAAPYQHLQASIFRAVENGIPMVHVANTGVSAFISRRGKVLDRVQDMSGKDIFVTGRKTLSLPMETKVTFYRKAGYLFPYFGVALFILMFFIQELRTRHVFRALTFRYR